MAMNHPSLRDLQSRDRNDGRKLRDHEYDDYFAGSLSGRNAQINRGVTSADAFILALK
jgi:hypothetical protein